VADADRRRRHHGSDARDDKSWRDGQRQAAHAAATKQASIDSSIRFGACEASVAVWAHPASSRACHSLLVSRLSLDPGFLR
jgi:hypothetical protein